MKTFEEWCQDREIVLNELSPKLLAMAYKILGEDCFVEGQRYEAENAALRERLDKAVLNRRIYYLASIWNDATLTRRKEVRCRTVDYVCDKFVECDGLILNWDKICFTREAAEACLSELKGEKGCAKT